MAPKNTKNLSVKKLLKTSALACLASGLSVGALSSAASAAAPMSVSIVVDANAAGVMQNSGDLTNANYVYANNGAVAQNAGFATAWGIAALQTNPLVLIGSANGCTFNALTTPANFWPATNILVNGANATNATFVTANADGVWELGAVSKAANATGTAAVTLNAATGAPVASYTRLPATLSAGLVNVGALVLDGKTAVGNVYTTGAAANGGTPVAMVAGYGALNSLVINTAADNAGIIDINTTNGITLGAAASGVSVTATGATAATSTALVLVSGMGSADGNIYVNAWGSQANPVGLVFNADKKLTVTGDTANAGATRNFGTVALGRGVGVTGSGTLEVNLTSITGDIFTTPGAAKGTFSAPLTGNIAGNVYAVGGTIALGNDQAATNITGAVYAAAGNLNIKTGGNSAAQITEVNLLGIQGASSPAAVTISGNASVTTLNSVKALPAGVGTAGTQLADTVNTTFTGANTIITNLNLTVGGVVSVKQVNQGTITNGQLTVTEGGAGKITVNGAAVTDVTLNLPNTKVASAQLVVADSKLGTVNVSGTIDSVANAFSFTDATNKAAIVLNAKGVNMLGAITAPAAILNLELAAATTVDKPLATGALNAKEINVISTAAGFVALGGVTTDALSFSAANKLVVQGDLGAADKKLALIKYKNTTASNAAGELNFAGSVYATSLTYDASTAPSTLSFEKPLMVDAVAATGDKLFTIALNSDQTTAANFDVVNGAIQTSKTVTFSGTFAKAMQFVTSKDAKGKLVFDPAAKDAVVVSIKTIGQDTAPYASVNFKKAAKVTAGLYADVVELDTAVFGAAGAVVVPVFTAKVDGTVVFASPAVNVTTFTADEGKKVDLFLGARNAEDGVDVGTIALTGDYGTSKTALNSVTVAKAVKELQLKSKIHAVTVAGLSDLKIAVQDKTSSIFGKADMNNVVVALAGENVLTFGGGVTSNVTGTLGYEVELTSATASGQWIVTGDKTVQDLSGVTAFNITVKAVDNLADKSKWTIMAVKDKGVIKFPKKDVTKITANNEKYKFSFDEGVLSLGEVAPTPDAPTDVSKVWSNMAGESFAKAEAKYMDYIAQGAKDGNETAVAFQAAIDKINNSSATEAEKTKQTAELLVDSSTSAPATVATASQAFFNTFATQAMNNSLGQSSVADFASAKNLGASAGDDCMDDTSWDLQLKPFYNGGDQKNDNAIGYKASQGGAFLSAGYRFDEDARVGLAIGYAGADIKAKTIPNRKITSNSMLFSIFGGCNLSPEVGLSGVFIMGSVKSNTPTISAINTGKFSFKNTVINALAKLDYSMEAMEGHTFNPYLSLGFGNVGSSKTTAKVSDKVGIEYNTKAVNWFQGVLGANYFAAIEHGESVIKPGVYANVVFGSKAKVTATEQFIGAKDSVPVPTITGQAVSYSVGLNVTAKNSKSFEFGAGAGFQFAKKYAGWNLQMTLGVAL